MTITHVRKTWAGVKMDWEPFNPQDKEHRVVDLIAEGSGESKGRIHAGNECYVEWKTEVENANRLNP